MRRMLLLAAMLLPAACGDWPDLGVGGEVEGYPQLVPFDEVTAPGALAAEAAADEAEADEALLERAKALRQRAKRLGPSDEDRDAFDALAERGPPAP